MSNESNDLRGFKIAAADPFRVTCNCGHVFNISARHIVSPEPSTFRCAKCDNTYLVAVKGGAFRVHNATFLQAKGIKFNEEEHSIMIHKTPSTGLMKLPALGGEQIKAFKANFSEGFQAGAARGGTHVLVEILKRVLDDAWPPFFDTKIGNYVAELIAPQLFLLVLDATNTLPYQDQLKEIAQNSIKGTGVHIGEDVVAFLAPAIEDVLGGRRSDQRSNFRDASSSNAAPASENWRTQTPRDPTQPRQN